MTDIDIFKLLYDIEPEDKVQEDKLAKMMDIILSKKERTLIDDFLETLDYDEVAEKRVSRVYEYYCDWCSKNNYTIDSRITLGKKVCERFMVKSVMVKQNGESFRVYKSS